MYLLPTRVGPEKRSGTSLSSCGDIFQTIRTSRCLHKIHLYAWGYVLQLTFYNIFKLVEIRGGGRPSPPLFRTVTASKILLFFLLLNRCNVTKDIVISVRPLFVDTYFA